MAHKSPNRALETSTTTGTGSYALAGAVAGYAAFSAELANGDTTVYYAEAVNASGVPTGDWEAGLGTWSTGGTLERTTIYGSSNAGAAVDWAAGTKRLGAGIAGGRNHQVNVQVFENSGTWVKPPWAQIVFVQMIGSGGGGGSGRRYGTTSARGGGSGSPGGAYGQLWLSAALLANTVSVTVGAGGAGGAAVTTNDTDGNPGANGGTVSFGSHLTLQATASGSSGNGGSFSSVSADPAPLGYGAPTGGSPGGVGGAGAVGAASDVALISTHILAAYGGGGGAGAISNSTTAAAGAAGGGPQSAIVGLGFRSRGAGGTTAGVAPTTGVSFGAGRACGSTGAGGGAYISGQAGMAGANGAPYGGGGGGGAASDNGFNSGAGGNGAAGVVVVTAW